jgi:Galactosyltransferase
MVRSVSAERDAVRSARLLVGVMTCRANRAREQAVRRTWLASPLPAGLAVLFVEGDGDESQPRLTGNRLTLPVRDSYELLPGKTRAFFRWAMANTSCDHILKCDDDSYLHLDVVSELDLSGVDYAGRLTPPVPGIVETWHFGKCRDPSSEVPFRGPFPDRFAEGFAYFVSRDAASLVADAGDEVVDGHILEDVFVGWCVGRDGVVRRDLSERVCARRSAWEPRRGAYVRHPLAPAEMVEAHRRFGAGR